MRKASSDLCARCDGLTELGGRRRAAGSPPCRPPLTNTRYINSISPEQEPFFPGDEGLERRIRRLIRWNAVAMVLRANSQFAGVGGRPAPDAPAGTPYGGG